MRALEQLLREREELTLWQTFMAEMAWSAARACYQEFPFPSYAELTKKTEKDERSAEEIRAGLAARLREEEMSKENAT